MASSARPRPWLAAVPLVAVAAILLNTGTDILPPDDVLKITLARVFILAGLVALVVLNGPRVALFRTGLEVPIALLLVAAVATTIHGRWNYPLLRFLFESVALFYLTVAFLRTSSGALPAISLVALAAVVVAASTGVAQVAQGQLTGFYREGFTPVVALGPQPPGTWTRAIGSFANPNLLATYVLMLAPLGAMAAVTAAGHQMKIVGWGLVGVAYLGLIFTFSRAGIGAALLGWGVAAFFARPRWRRPVLTGLGVVVVALVVGTLASGGGLISGFGRPVAWSTALDAINQNKVFGTGLGRAADVMNAMNPGLTFRHAHDLWLTWWVEAGPVALVAWIWITLWLVVRGLRCVTAGTSQAGYTGAALVGLLGFFAFSVVDHPANVARIATTFWLVAAVVAATPLPKTVATSGPDPPDGEETQVR